jgi:hypothetical protein
VATQLVVVGHDNEVTAGPEPSALDVVLDHEPDVSSSTPAPMLGIETAR